MRITITGSTGLIGTALVESLSQAGHAITRVARDPRAAAGAVRWDPARGEIDAAGLEGHDAVIHLAGEPIAGGRWTAERKRRILESRTRGTTLLARTLAGLARPPRALLCASAVGYYGNRPPDQAADESSPRGEGFTAHVTVEWERAAAPAQAAGIRVVHMRFGPVLSARGGYLSPLLPLFRLGLGGRFGSGRQILSWVAIDDLEGAVAHLLARDDLAGPVNVTAPNAVSNAEFARTLARVLRRPSIIPAPALALRVVLGELADEVLHGARVVPRRLLDSGYTFAYPELEPALRHVLRRSEGSAA